MGCDTYGQLGDGTTVSKTTPVKIDTGVTAVAAGFYHSLYLKSNGSVYAMGMNSTGQLGDGTGLRQLTPVKVATGATAIAAGYFHSIYLSKNGHPYGTGDNEDGQLGTEDTDDIFTFKQLKDNDLVINNVISIAAGGYHSMYANSGYVLHAMGCDTYGQLGDGEDDDCQNEVQQIDYSVASMACGRFHSMYLTIWDEVYVCGDGEYGQLGVELDEDYIGKYYLGGGIAQVAAGRNVSFYISFSNDLYGTGLNDCGQLGLGNTDEYDGFTYIASDVYEVSSGTATTFYLTDVAYDLSLFTPVDSLGGKWSDAWGWIDDTYMPWVYNYNRDLWFYVVDYKTADIDEGYWIYYVTSDGSDSGWGFVETTGWWSFGSSGEWKWQDF